MSRISEQRDVQNNLIHYLMGNEWTYLPPGDVVQQRNGDETQPFLPGVLRGQLLKLNPGLVTAANVDDIIRRLRLLPANLAGHEEYVKALRGQWTVYDTAEKRERNLALIDYDDLDANDFHFTQELHFVDRDRRRLDMVLWVNGLPVAVIENKAPHLAGPEMEAFSQVQETYIERIPEFIKYPPLMVAAARGLHYAPTWNADSKAMNAWKVQDREYGLERLSQDFLDRGHVLGLLRDYMIFYRADDQTRKLILRPHQMRAVDKIQSGLHWHTQGSGKTLTMIVSAHVLRREMARRGQNPSLIMVVDRIDLEGQMAQNLKAFGFPAVERARNKGHLRQLLLLWLYRHAH
jgi:type I restriction enzyme R subunit